MAEGDIRARKLKQGRIMIVAGTLLGVLYVMFSDGFVAFYPFVNGAIAGAFAGLAVAVLELGLFAGALRRSKFGYLLLIRTLTYLVLLTTLILLVIIISRMIRLDQGFSQVLNDPSFHHYIFYEDFPIVVVYTLALAFSINFIRMISRKMGQGMLVSYVTGSYRKPVLQERVVMFLKLKNSMAISQQLGPLIFQDFLNDVFHDITESILAHQGTIYEYVEDLIVITWNISQGLDNANCIRCYYHATEELEIRRSKYYAKYGVVPLVYAALHAGELIRVEIGDIKSEIVFHGDVMNTTSRILDQCRVFESDLLVSDALLCRLNLPEIFTSDNKGIVKLKGKVTGMGVCEIIEKTSLEEATETQV